MGRNVKPSFHGKFSFKDKRKSNHVYKGRKVQALEATIRLRNYVKRVACFKHTPRAIRVIQRKALEFFPKVGRVRIDSALNKFMWKDSVKRCPHKIRIKFSVERRRSAKNKLCIVCTHIPVMSFKGLHNKRIFKS